MMKRIYTILLACVLPACSALAQHIPFHTEWKGEEQVTLKFDLSVPENQGGSDYAVWIVPFVYNNQGDTLELEPVVFRGKRNARYVERARFFGDADEAKNEELRSGDVFCYAATLSASAHPWLKKGRIEVDARMEKEGCCEVETLPGAHYGHFAYIPPFVPQTVKLDDKVSKAEEWQKTNPVLAHISDYRPYDNTRILRKEKGMLYVYHPFDKADLLRDFRENAPVLDKIVAMTRDIMADKTSTVKLIQIVGMASIEGPVKYNEELALRRAVSMKEYIQERVNVPDELFELCNGGEGWSELRDQINDSDFEGSKEIVKIIDETADPQLREKKMKQLMGGRPYAYIKKHILRDQRNSGYLRVYYDYVPDENANLINRASELLQQQKYAEARQMLTPIAADSRAWNTLGVALYMTGQHAEAMALLRRAAAAGDPQAKRNVEQFEAIQQAQQLNQN